MDDGGILLDVLPDVSDVTVILPVNHLHDFYGLRKTKELIEKNQSDGGKHRMVRRANQVHAM